ncbi:MAG: rhomboid family intramembrane serine protease [Planctomycetota bacterium]
MTQHLRFDLPRPASAVQALLAANIAVMLASAILGPHVFGDVLTGVLGLSWDALSSGYGLGIVRLVTYQFAHGGLMHLVFNMIVLYFFSRIVTTDTGDRGLIHLYLVGGVLGGICQLLLGAAAGLSDGVLVLGASGAVYAIMVYGACLAPRQTVLLFFVFPIELRWLVTFLVLAGVYASFQTLHGVGGSTADAAHLGGALWGYLAFRKMRGYYLGLGHRGAPLWPALARMRAARSARHRASLQAELDRLLEKVHREGMGSLSEAERRALERASRDLHSRGR